MTENITFPQTMYAGGKNVEFFLKKRSWNSEVFAFSSYLETQSNYKGVTVIKRIL